MSSEKIWDLVSAVCLVRKIEKAVVPLGWHVGLRGSVLTTTGWSENDIDVLIYARSDCKDRSIERVLQRLDTIGLNAKKLVTSGYGESPSTLPFYTATMKDRRIEILFLPFVFQEPTLIIEGDEPCF